MLELRQLRTLGAVSASGSMSRAAEQLSFTPSAVSQQIAALERQMGVELLVRHARGVRLTEVGKVLVERGAALDDQLVALEEDARDLIAGRGGRLRLAAFSSASGRLVPEAIDRFRRVHPEVRMTLDIRDPQAAADAVRSGAADVALIFGYADGPQIEIGDLRRSRLVEDPMMIAVPAGHPLAGRRRVSIGEFRQDAWIIDCSPDPTCREALTRLCSEAGYRPIASFESDDYLAIGRLVAAGVGVAFIPGLAVEQMPSGVSLLQLRPQVRRQITALRSVTAPPVADAMIDALVAVADEVEVTPK